MICEEIGEKGYNIDFGTVEMGEKDALFWDFSIDFKVLGQPWTHSVKGFISSNGNMDMVSYNLGNNNEGWQTFKNK